MERLPECTAQSFIGGPHGEPVLIEEQRWTDIKISLKKQLLLVYSPVHPDKFIEYKLEGTNWSRSASYSDYVITGDVVHYAPAPVVHRKRLAEAIHGIGGIGVFLFLFAKVCLGHLLARLRFDFHPGLPDCMNKLAKLLTMLFVFHCICLLFSLFFLTALMMVWLNYSRNLATLLPPGWWLTARGPRSPRADHTRERSGGGRDIAIFVFTFHVLVTALPALAMLA